mmetsp:Transcript_26651/g.30765  ORF Transcript_26651/g.30765 Transcript_26651/m.30765 type:complete len:201 (-) Transcript_26651:10-612(-)
MQDAPAKIVRRVNGRPTLLAHHAVIEGREGPAPGSVAVAFGFRPVSSGCAAVVTLAPDPCVIGDGFNAEHRIVPQTSGFALTVFHGVEDLVLHGEGVVRGVGSDHNLPAPRLFQFRRHALVRRWVIQMSHENLFRRTGCQGLTPPFRQYGNFGSIQNRSIAVETIVLLEDAEGELFELGCFVAHDYAVAAHLIAEVYRVE